MVTLGKLCNAALYGAGWEQQDYIFRSWDWESGAPQWSCRSSTTGIWEKFCQRTAPWGAAVLRDGTWDVGSGELGLKHKRHEGMGAEKTSAQGNMSWRTWDQNISFLGRCGIKNRVSQQDDGTKIRHQDRRCWDRTSPGSKSTTSSPTWWDELGVRKKKLLSSTMVGRKVAIELGHAELGILSLTTGWEPKKRHGG